MSIETKPAARPSVPPTALLLSLLSLWVPVLSSALFPAWTNADVGILVWLLALIPPFLLSYYRGWRGASLALAAGMAAFAIAQVGVTLVGAPTPSPELMLGLNVVLITVALGTGALAASFHRTLGQAERLALTDAGTGLPNRRHGMIHLERAFAAASRGAPLSVILFDLDRFKSINDRYGHHTGDEVLRAFGEILLHHTRAMNLTVRFGGEEFLAILDGVGAKGATIMAQRVLDSLRSRRFPWGHVTVSAGIAEWEAGMASPDVLIAAADQALYRAKGRGGDTVMVLGRQGADADQTVTPPPPTAPVKAREGSGELVLVVDDDPAVLRTLSQGLRRRHYHPIEARDPARALQIARGLSEPIDLVITDLVMPGMSGFRLVEMLMEHQPELRALYISGYSGEEVRWSGAPGSLRAFLPKPITLDALTRAVRSCLDAPLPDPAERAAAPVVQVAGDDGAAGPPATADAPTAPSDDDGAVADGPIWPQQTPPSEEDPDRLRDRLEASAARLDEAHTEILLRLAWAVEYRDDAGGRHARRVAKLAALIAAELGLDDEDVGRIEHAALLHDVGKIGIPDSLVGKPGELTDSEAEVMRQHCAIGANLLGGSRHPLLLEAEQVAHFHHEHWDGSGYPDNLAGTDIPLAARIAAVADAFDHLAGDQGPARFDSRAALDDIAAGRGSRFDPDVVDAFHRLARSGALSSLARLDVAGEWRGPDARDAAVPPTLRVAGGG